MPEHDGQVPAVDATSDDGGTAPLPLRWVEEFVNTRSVEFGTEDLDGPQTLRAWLCDRGLLPGDADVTETELDRAKRVREGLRALIGAGHELARPDREGIDRGAVTDLAVLARELPLVLSVTDGRPALVPRAAASADAALATLLGVVAGAVADGTWDRLKVCREPGCRWAYYDHSRNRSRTWCSMASCGNRAKARAFRDRGR